MDLDGIDDVSRFAFFSCSAPGTHSCSACTVLAEHVFPLFPPILQFHFLPKTRKIKPHFQSKIFTRPCQGLTRTPTDGVLAKCFEARAIVHHNLWGRGKKMCCCQVCARGREDSGLPDRSVPGHCQSPSVPLLFTPEIGSSFNCVHPGFWCFGMCLFLSVWSG